MDIVDCHAHIFPPLWEACGFQDAETHLLYQQRAMHTHGNQPVRRLRDHQAVQERHLWDARDPSEGGRARDVRFRVGRCGRFEWERDGEGYYVQFLPPGLQGMAAPPEFMAVQMDYAGVRAAVLLPTGLFADAQDRVRFPESVTRMMEDFPVYSEVLYPIAWGGKTDFPYLRAQDHLRQVYDRFGPDRLIWGSDMPNVERYCTYRQALTYVQDYCDFLSGADREKILGRNVLSLFGVEEKPLKELTCQDRGGIGCSES